MDLHHSIVAKLACEVKSFYVKREPFYIYHGSTNCTRRGLLDPRYIVDTSSLSSILTVNVASRLVTVEPNVPMDLLVQETLKVGLVPAVIPESPGVS